MRILRAVGIGMLVMLAGTMPRNALFALNLGYFNSVPWAVPLTAVYLWTLWRYLNGAWAPASTAAERRESLRAVQLTAQTWLWALVAGAIGIAWLVVALRLANRLVTLPPQQLPDLAHVPRITVVSLLVFAAPVAGVVEEAAFRGYMQGPIERHHGIVIAILVTGTMFAVAHLDFTLVLWPYYVAVAAIYGLVTYRTRSVLPAVVLHTAGNLYSNTDLLLHGRADWQAPALANGLVWQAGVDRDFLVALGALLFAMLVMAMAFRKLKAVTAVHDA